MTKDCKRKKLQFAKVANLPLAVLIETAYLCMLLLWILTSSQIIVNIFFHYVSGRYKDCTGVCLKYDDKLHPAYWRCVSRISLELGDNVDLDRHSLYFRKCNQLPWAILAWDISTNCLVSSNLPESMSILFKHH